MASFASSGPSATADTQEFVQQTDDPVNTSQPMLADSYGDDTSDFDSEMSDLTSLSSSILNYEYQNGRRYHSGQLIEWTWYVYNLSPRRMIHAKIYDQGTSYVRNYGPFPMNFNSTNILPSSWLLLLKGELYRAPIRSPRNILDLGTGTGIWAIDMAECVGDWPRFFKRCYDCLKPGAYFEIQESAVWIWSDDGSCPYDSALFEWVRAMDTASKFNGKPCNIYPYLRHWMINAGFEDVQQFVYFLPYSPWPRDPYLKEIGKYQLVQAQQAVEAYSMRLFTDVLGWGEDVSMIFQAQAKHQLLDKNMHAYVKEFVVYGRKPSS
ncbi:hypothetical protein N7456_005524 [Penicillium angulare]|uniref:S-adenosyl-L-methionine-dependent methyltransferase n=1 Tax=Penicillium angulare TaxID=116970 RepID=A0A9W9FYI6_9EURO|nr:hypothetical protein N7456_005524 [Penicillium angulare]